MVNPVKNQPIYSITPSGKKKSKKEIDQRVNKIVRKTSASFEDKPGRSIKASPKTSTEKAYLAAERAANAARQRAFEAKEAAIKAQKAALLAQRAHMAQQSAAARRARAEEKARRVAKKATQKAHALRRVMKIKAYLAGPNEKKRDKLLKEYLEQKPKKKNPRK